MLEVGKVLEGKVTGITKFGAFVTFESGEKGLVHISEVSSTYVENIAEHLQEGQVVKVKVLSVGDDGKISLSIKKAQPIQRPNQTQNKEKNFNNNNNRNNDNAKRNFNKSKPASNNRNYNDSNNKQQAKGGFEDMLSKFMQSSDEKIYDIKRSKEVNRRAGSTRRGR